MTRQPRQDEGRVGHCVCHSCRRCWAAAPRPDERDAVPQPMGRRVGIEPTTTGSTNRGSTAELTTPCRAGGQAQPGPLSARRLSTVTQAEPPAPGISAERFPSSCEPVGLRGRRRDRTDTGLSAPTVFKTAPVASPRVGLPFLPEAIRRFRM